MSNSPKQTRTKSAASGQIIPWLKIKPSAQSLDYVKRQTQFQLHSLLTEQRHPKTAKLSFKLKTDTAAGLGMLLSVDEDISAKIKQLAGKMKSLDQAADAVATAITERRKIYFYGCGATGRLAKQMESSLWRPFWRKLKASPLWAKLQAVLPENIEDQLIGEMTGGDRALISSLEGFEDLQLIGDLQIKDRGIQKGDVVFCVTEGGETSSVIGTILSALKQYGKLTPQLRAEAQRRLYFVYNNPDKVLLPFERSRTVIENPAITKIPLFTGPQSITGSTRMQATSSETFVMGVVLEEGLQRFLSTVLTRREMAQLGFPAGVTLRDRLLSFVPLQRKVSGQRRTIAALTDLESSTYAQKHFSTYFADRSLITVFIDSTERSPTFKLYPLDTVHEQQRKCWLQVWTPAADGAEAWQKFLGRPFYGLDAKLYERPFATQVKDKYLKEAALRSLANAGNEQQFLYDFSFAAANIARCAPAADDLGVVVISDDEAEQLNDPSSPLMKWLTLFGNNKAAIAAILIGAVKPAHKQRLTALLQAAGVPHTVIFLPLAMSKDPLGLRREIALKLILNAHSTAIMAKLGRVLGNTMTNVHPGNLKLIGRATFLALSHINETIKQPAWIKQYGRMKPVSYAEVNHVLFDVIDFNKRTGRSTANAEVAVTIVRTLEAIRRRGPVTNEEAMEIVNTVGLENYLLAANPSLAR